MNYNNYKDSLKKYPFIPRQNVNKANCCKRLVSKNKIRFENEYFDLDLVYITERVIAMGYPSFTCEKYYRNDVSDVIRLFTFYHNNNVKVYNLCLETDRIYDKSLFMKSQVGLFPSLDHNPCPIKLILDFCVDICLYIIKNETGVAAIHCKAGKGRTGVMICSYLIFSNLCKNSEEALQYYGMMRTHDNKGVTIPSQIRYIKYFEAFLCSNFTKPYIYLLPKIIKEHLIDTNEKVLSIKNLLINLQNDSKYYKSINSFMVKQIKFGPLNDNKANINIALWNFWKMRIHFFNPKSYFKTNNKGEVYYIFAPELIKNKFNFDFKIEFTGDVNCYTWINLWYSTLETIANSIPNSNEKGSSEMIPSILENSNNNKQKQINQTQPNSSGFINTQVIEMSEIKPTNIKIQKFPKNYIEFNGDEEDNNDNSKEEIINTNKKSMSASIDSNKTIFKVQHNTNLIEIIDQINQIQINNKQKIIDKSNLKIYFSSVELDKFKEKKNMKNIQLEITYSLL